MRETGRRIWLNDSYVDLIPRSSASDEERARAWTSGMACWEIERALDDHQGIGTTELWRLAESLEYGHAPASLWDTERRVRTALLCAIGEGRLLVVPETPRANVGGSRRRVPAEPPPSAQELTWIEIELLGDNNKPRAGVRYVLTTPTGQRREGTLDQRGRARIEHLLPGTCEVRFPDLIDPVTLES
mgnify:CR=1 FL=1